MLRAGLALLVLGSGCFSAHAAEPERTTTGATALSPVPAPGPAPIIRCPGEMAIVDRPQGSFCIDRYEASLELVRPGSPGNSTRSPWPGNRSIENRGAEFVAVSVAGRKPQGYVSGDQAERACENAGKRLCQIDEWTRACRGPSGRKYPYGDERRAAACNDRFAVLDAHPVARLFDQVAPKGMPRARMWEPFFMNDPRLHELSQTVEPSGSRATCVSEAGVYDLVGNLHEWVADPAGTFVGGFFMDTFQNGEGCEYRTTAHRRDYHDYSTGFRCCRDADAGAARGP